jgi:RimJ/RimL family protein N-acetyltransferase
VSQPVFLTTARMAFRWFTPADGSLLFELDSDPEVMRFISKGEPTPMARIEQVFLPRILGYTRLSPPQGFWVALSKDAPEFIGWFHLRPDKLEPEEMELGYRLKRRFWGQGLATEGARALIDKAFYHWGYPKVCARTLAGNLASQRVMAKCGLRFETEFYYGEDLLPGWSFEERCAVKYSATR